MTPVTAAELRTLIAAAGITQREAAELCHAAERTVRDWLAGARVPLASSELLALALMTGPSPRVVPTQALASRWLRPAFAAMAQKVLDD